jgi:hypothetical protein
MVISFVNLSYLCKKSFYYTLAPWLNRSNTISFHVAQGAKVNTACFEKVTQNGLEGFRVRN